ncbi:MAG: hypothetical protein RMJ56_15625, partial [Gemmataceae bacterium]|nr:hypothetical protein [Gemmata sp.]MDW8199027.1 hypothetical protein [Gemmataceae bacterium]
WHVCGYRAATLVREKYPHKTATAVWGNPRSTILAVRAACWGRDTWLLAIAVWEGSLLGT